jgi:hypothetical protein
MAKAKFKIGNLVECPENNFGVIDKVVTSAEGYSYIINGSDDEHAEDDICKAFKEIAPKKTRSSKKAKVEAKVAPAKKAAAKQAAPVKKVTAPKRAVAAPVEAGEEEELPM